MAHLRDIASLSKEAIFVLRACKSTAAGDLQGHSPLQLCIEGLVNSAKGAKSEAREQREFTQLGEFVLAPGLRPPGIDAECAAAGRAEDFLLVVGHYFDRIVAVGAV